MTDPMGYTDAVPVQYRRKNEKFLGMDIFVDERVLIPRPETELLVSAALRVLSAGGIKKPRVLDLCTGSGVVGLGILRLLPGAVVTASDVSLDALQVAEINIARHSACGRMDLVLSDLFEAFEKSGADGFDCVVSNPPYVSERDYRDLDPWVKAEPKIALDGGEEGMDKLKEIIRNAPGFLKNGGHLAVEIGYDQSDKVRKCFIEAGFVETRAHRDMNGFDRVITGRKNG